MDTFSNILSTVGTVVFIVFFFGFCIFIHEFGHLLAAVWQGLYVDKFSIGFGKKLFGFKYKGIDFVVSLLPLGGYVSIPQLDPTDEPKAEDGRKLSFASPKARAITAFAGPFFNILFGFVLATALWIFGAWQTPKTSSCVVMEVPVVVPVFNGESGVEPGERITRIRDRDVQGLQLKSGAFGGALMDLCVFWQEFPEDFQLPTEDGAILPMTVVNGEGEERQVDYEVRFNNEYTAGLRAGDRILAFGGERLSKGVDELTELHAYNEHPMACITVKREGQPPLELEYEQRQNTLLEDLRVPFFQARNPLTIGDVLPGTPAEKAGLKRSDQLLAYDDKPMMAVSEFLAYVNGLTGQTTLSLLIARDGVEQQLELSLPSDGKPITAEKLGLAFIVTVRAVFQDTPADKAGLKPYDRLVKLNDMEVTDGKTFSERVKAQEGKPLTLTVLRDGHLIVLKDISALVTGVDGTPKYILGIQMDDLAPKVLAHPSPWEQFTSVFTKTAKTLWLLFQPITNTVLGRSGDSSVKLKHMSSFVGITAMLWYTVKTEGIRGGLAFIILITFGLAFANLLPFPVLDGGHILFSAIEFVIRRRLPCKFMSIVSNIFAGLLIALMLYITYNDIRRLPKINKAYSGEKPKLKLAAPVQESAEPSTSSQEK